MNPDKISKDIENDVVIQKENWERLATHIATVVGSLKPSTVEQCYRNLLQSNLIRGKEILASSVLKYQTDFNQGMASAALVALVNSEFPEFGDLVIREAIARFISGYKSNDKRGCYSMMSLISYSFCYQVVHEILILQLIHLLMERPTNDSVDLVISLLRQCGKSLVEVSKVAHTVTYEKLRDLLQEGRLSERTAHSVEDLFELRRFNYDSVSLNLISLPAHKINTHTIILDLEKEESSKQNMGLAEFQYDPFFFENESKYELFKKRLLETDAEEDTIPITTVKDMTNNDELAFKKTIYLILKSSLSGDEAAHKLLKLRASDGQKHKIVDILVSSCSQEATYSKFYGITAERLCSSHRSWKPAFSKIFAENYENVTQFEPFQLRNVGKFWGHILASDYIGFEVFEQVHMNEEETTSSGRVYLKFLFQELVADLGIKELVERLREEYIQPFLANIFPLDNSEKTRFSINYFTAIGLGALTENMRRELMRTEEEETLRGKSNVDTLLHEGRLAAPVRGRNEVSISLGYQNINRSPTPVKRRDRSITPPSRNRNRSITPTKRSNRSITPPRRQRSRSPPRNRPTTSNRFSNSPLDFARPRDNGWGDRPNKKNR